MNIDWSQLGFSYMDTACHLRYTWKDGEWDEGHLQTEPYMNLHIAATALHYGQSAFEGLKAFSGPDGKVRIFRLNDNAKRLARSAKRILMPEVSEDMFRDAILRAVEANKDYIPPYGTGGSLYIRPLLFGSGATIGVNPSSEYTFIVMVIPVGDYYKGGLKPVGALIVDGYDRAAPRGIGSAKVAGNYAADLEPNAKAKALGYPINLYLDAKTNKYIEEFGTSNFIAFRGTTYITPDSESILQSITNKTLQQLAIDNGYEVESRPVEFSEVETFDEVAACGTAVVVTPINKIVYGEKEYNIGEADVVGASITKLYQQVRAIQMGEAEDKWNWNTIL